MHMVGKLVALFGHIEVVGRPLFVPSQHAHQGVLWAFGVELHVPAVKALGLEVPAGDVIGSIQARFHADDGGGGFGRPRHAFFSRPLHAHRTAKLFGQQGCFVRGLIGVAATIGARTMHPLELHIFSGQTQKLGNAVAQEVGFLHVAPNFNLVAHHADHTARRCNAGVHLKAALIFSLNHFG